MNGKHSDADSDDEIRDKEFEKLQKVRHARYLALVDRFMPDDDDMVLFKDDPKWQRLIFPPYEGYRDIENDKYEEFVEHLDGENIEVPEWVTKRMHLRVLEGEEFKTKQASKRLLEHLKWREETLPITLNDNMHELIADLGLFYTHGRDRSLRPLTFFQPIVVVGRKVDLEESLLACHYVAQHIIENMMVIGKVENWINVLDLAKLSVSSLPKSWIIAFIKSFSSNTYARTRCMYLLNAGTAVAIVWAVVKVFVHWTVKKKIVFNKKNTDPSLQE